MADQVVSAQRHGPLRDVRVVELAGLAPVPYAATMLADLGADVLRIDRPSAPDSSSATATTPTTGTVDAVAAEDSIGALGRGRRSITLDLKNHADVTSLVEILDRADVLLEGFRPGTCERLGFGPDVCCGRNPRLIYARLSGWGHDGPLAAMAGHDLCYLAVSGALAPLGTPNEPPRPPLNYLADFAGGGMLVAHGVLAALYERERSGRGQVVDAAMVDGASLLTTQVRSLRAQGLWSDERGTNLLDGGAPFYRCYTCADGRYVAVGALEPRFYAALLRGLGLDEADLPQQYDRDGWPLLAERLSTTFAARPRDEWADLFSATDACVAPVLGLDEAPDHPHARARKAFAEVDGLIQPVPAPRLSRTPGAIQGPSPSPGQHDGSAPHEWEFNDDTSRR